jgi:outer membrane protein OmpA-like peptidoglycan-associated protein
MKTLLGALALLLAATPSQAQEIQDTLHIHFSFDQAALTPEARARLDSFVAAYTSDTMHRYLQVRGHTDAVGSLPYNAALSKRRTATVRDYLLAGGIPKAEVVHVEGYGETIPLNDNRTALQRQLNRRVELIWNLKVPQIPKPHAPTDSAPEFSKAAIDTVKEGSTLRLRNINFYGGRHTFLPQAQPALSELVEVMKAYPSLAIEIQGHICCRYGTTEDGMDFDSGDMRLSHNRARAVYDYLIEQGIDKGRMTYRGFAGTTPLVWPEQTEADRTLNRRVEIKIIKR